MRTEAFAPSSPTTEVSPKSVAVGLDRDRVVQLDAHALEALAEVEAVLGRVEDAAASRRYAGRVVLDHRVRRHAPAVADHDVAPAARYRWRAPRSLGEVELGRRQVAVRGAAGAELLHATGRCSPALPTVAAADGTELVKTKMPSEVASSASGFGSCIQKPFDVRAVTIPSTRTVWPA